jgi:hypothetical protein
MLTGLARDGGLYVPEVWPQLSRETIASFFGRPYWEVAVDVIKPFAAGEIYDADIGRMAKEANATIRHCDPLVSNGGEVVRAPAPSVVTSRHPDLFAAMPFPLRRKRFMVAVHFAFARNEFMIDIKGLA